jgi:hypothetical protein
MKVLKQRNCSDLKNYATISQIAPYFCGSDDVVLEKVERSLVCGRLKCEARREAIDAQTLPHHPVHNFGRLSHGALLLLLLDLLQQLRQLALLIEHRAADRHDAHVDANQVSHIDPATVGLYYESLV